MQTSITTWLKKPLAVKQPPQDASSLPEPSSQQSLQPQLPQQPPDTAAAAAANNNNNEPPPTPPPSQPDANPLPIFKSKTPPLPPNIRLQPCSTQHHLSSFQRLNTILLPIPYPQKFYHEILSDRTTNSITLLALWFDDPSSSSSAEKGRVIGGIRCRLLPDASSRNPEAAEKSLLYVSTLGVLAPYRSLGVATRLLREMIVKAIQEFGVGAVGAHVWEVSSEARAWYKKRGFREVNKEEGYYRRLQPQGAFVLRRDIGPRDLLSI